jgi:hypothetical protein
LAGYKTAKEFKMAKRSLFVSVLVAVLVCGFFLGSCDTGTNGGGDKTFTLSVTVADGSSGLGSVSITSGSPTGNAAGASVTVTAAAAADHHFMKWSNNMAGVGSVSTTNPYTFNINADTSLCAVFAPYEENDNWKDQTLPPTNSSLIISGLSSFNGQYVTVWSQDYTIYGFTDAQWRGSLNMSIMKGALISGGQAELPIYLVGNVLSGAMPSGGSYTKSGPVTFYILISPKMWVGRGDGTSRTLTANFYNGKGTGTYSGE